MNERLIQLDDHPATIRKLQALDRVPCGEDEPLVRCRVWLEVEDLTADQLKTTACPEAALAFLQSSGGDEGTHVDRLAIRRSYAAFTAHLAHETAGRVNLTGVSVVLTPTLRGVEGTTVFAFTLEADLSVDECADLLRLLGGEVSITTSDLQLSLITELSAA